MIFVQIAAYRDPELLPTILDCIAKAKYKSNLRFGICWQAHDSDRSIQPLEDDPQFTIERIPWYDSKGLCWARSKIQQMYNGEEFTLQLDSHHRFAEHWDVKLMEMMEQSGSEKPILTTYAGSYDPATNRKNGDEPYKMVADRFTPSGTIIFVPHVIKEWKDLSKPVPARFVSGHFYFTLGRHCQEYTYDPLLYFAGDEISLSIRSFTIGYDIFHPHRTLVWHEYTRKGRVKHWDDHTLSNRHLVEAAWHERDVISKMRLRKLLQEECNDADLTGYELGNLRSHRDYEIYAGIDFQTRRLHRDTISGVNPPCHFESAEQWEAALASDYELNLKWNPTEIDFSSDQQFVYFGIEDECGNVIFRYDAPPDSPEVTKQVDAKAVKFRAGSRPSKFVIWPVSKSKGWGRKSIYNL